jgi:hypothetical protein
VLPPPQVPVYDHEWLVAVLLAAQLPEGLQPAGARGGLSQDAAGAAPALPSPEVAGRGGRRSGRGAAAAAAAAPGQQHRQQQQQQQEPPAGRQQQQQQLVGPGLSSQEAPATEEPPQQQQRRKRARHSGTPRALAPAAAAATPEPATTPAAGLAAARLATPGTGTGTAGAISWVGEPLAPPAGAAAAPTALAHRRHYGAFRRDGATLRVGDCALLLPRPGEQLPLVVRIDALWQETPSDGAPRQLARCTRFYWPQETIFPVGGAAGEGPRHLFVSGHVEEHVPLAALGGKCWVVAASGPGGAGAVPRGAPADRVFQCGFFYDQEAMTLGAAAGR